MELRLLEIMRRLASKGTAPETGCSRLGVGNEEAISRLEREYIFAHFDAGMSAEKYVIGPNGSGKTHFLRELMEVARDRDCVTAEVQLGKQLDFTKPLIVYKELAREVKAPDSQGTGIHELIIVTIERHREAGSLPDWLSLLERPQLKLREFGLAARAAAKAYLDGDMMRFEDACRWLAGEVSDKDAAKAAGVAKVATAEHDITGARLRLSLAQFIRLSGFRGSVFCFDEGDEGFNVDRKKLNKILSLIRSQLDAVADLKGGSALFVYALTKPIVEAMENYPALLDRVRDPGPGQSFFEGNTLAPKIDLTFRPNPEDDLRRIGMRWVDLVYDEFPDQARVDREVALESVRRIAQEVNQEDSTASARRLMVKRTCTYLLGALGVAVSQPAGMQADEEKEV